MLLIRDGATGDGDYYGDVLNAGAVLIHMKKRMEKILYILLLGLVACSIGAILSYLMEGKINWIPALGPAIGVTIAAFFSLDLNNLPVIFVTGWYRPVLLIRDSSAGVGNHHGNAWGIRIEQEVDSSLYSSTSRTLSNYVRERFLTPRRKVTLRTENTIFSAPRSSP